MLTHQQPDQRRMNGGRESEATTNRCLTEEGSLLTGRRRDLKRGGRRYRSMEGIEGYNRSMRG